jgi:hypothetical protein
MTDQSSPFTPPTELVRQWIRECDNPEKPRWQEYEQDIATRAAQWGWNKRGTINDAQLQERADQELEACYYWIENYHGTDAADSLQHGRRPKPPSLKEQAIAELEKIDMLWDTGEFSQNTLDSLDTIRRALEALPND